MLTVWQPTLLLHNRPTVSYTPSSPARCTELNWPEIIGVLTNVAGALAHIGRLHGRYARRPTQTCINSNAHRKYLFRTRPAKAKKSPNSQRSQFGNGVCFAPNALFAYSLTAHSITLHPAYCFYTPLISHMLHALARERLIRKYSPLQLKTYLTDRIVERNVMLEQTVPPACSLNKCVDTTLQGCGGRSPLSCSNWYTHTHIHCISHKRPSHPHTPWDPISRECVCLMSRAMTHPVPKPTACSCARTPGCALIYYFITAQPSPASQGEVGGWQGVQKVCAVSVLTPAVLQGQLCFRCHFVSALQKAE